jgi:hypothetical protein
MTPTFKLALAFGCIGAALLLGAFASSLNRQARENATPTPDPLGVSEPQRTRVPVTSVAPPTTPQAVFVPTPQPGNGTLPMTFTCPQGWTAQNVTGRGYAFCTPPGWSARIGAANTPRNGEPEGSAVRTVSPEQVAVSGTPRTGTALTPAAAGSVVDIYVTSYQLSADLPKQPMCTAPTIAVGGVPVAACDLDNATDNSAPFRYRALYGRPSNETFLHVLVTLGRNVTNEQAQTARQIASTVVFY